MADAVLTHGKTYRVTFWAKVSGTESLVFSAVRLRNNETTAGWPSKGATVTVNGETWTQYTVDLVVDLGENRTTDDLTGCRLVFQIVKDCVFETPVELGLDNITMVELAD